MNIIGISGLESSVPFKKKHWPGLEEREYRISQGHDSAAALIVDGVCVAAAAEERFTRQKHSAGFPINAIQYCLREAGLQPGDVDECRARLRLFAIRPSLFRERIDLGQSLRRCVFKGGAAADWSENTCRSFPRTPCFPGWDHHKAHAASAACTSGWDDCLTVVIDGMGEAESASIFHAHDGKLDRLSWVPVHDSIGILYSLITLHLGFDFNSDEYKIMGLAPYGDPSRFPAFFEETVLPQKDGTIRIPILGAQSYFG